jgi:putative FmdB family regulatory protein
MPTYQYHCRNCGHTVEEFQSMTEDPLVTCPECRTDNLVRIMGAGAGLIFKGSGFYLTDYRKPAPTSPDAPAKPSSGTSSSSGGTTPAKD